MITSMDMYLNMINCEYQIYQAVQEQESYVQGLNFVYSYKIRNMRLTVRL